jgi:HSP20 family protein
MATMTAPTNAAPATTRREGAERKVPTVSPRVDIYETEKVYVLLADMPGIGPEGLDVVAERNELIVRGRVEPPATTPDYQEFELANYYRAFALTEDLDTSGITATLKDGVLKVEIPKSLRVQPKKIQVRVE